MVDRVTVYRKVYVMPLSKEKMREYMRKRRSLDATRGLGLEEKEVVLDHPDNLGKDVVVGEAVIAEHVPGISYTETDKLFELDRPNYYIYDRTSLRQRDCWRCGKHFVTQLEMNKFCGPKCKNAWLASAFGKLKS